MMNELPIFSRRGPLKLFQALNAHGEMRRMVRAGAEQREFAKNWVLEVGYVGTRGVGLLGTGRPLNPSQICTTAKPCTILAAIGSAAAVPAGTPGTVKNSDGSITITQSTAANRDARV